MNTGRDLCRLEQIWKSMFCLPSLGPQASELPGRRTVLYMHATTMTVLVPNEQSALENVQPILIIVENVEKIEGVANC